MPTEPMPTDPTTPEPMSPESTTAAATTKNRKEPAYLFSEKQVAEKSELARRFLDNRTRLNENVHKDDNLLVKRFYILDHNPYLEGALPAKYKEYPGLLAKWLGKIRVRPRVPNPETTRGLQGS